MKQFRDYRIFALVPIAAISVQLGVWWGAGHYANYIRTEGSGSITEIERWTGLSQGLVPWTMATVSLSLLIAWRLMPVPTGSDRAALEKLAREKLSQPLLTADETQLWATVLDEVTKHERTN